MAVVLDPILCFELIVTDIVQDNQLGVHLKSVSIWIWNYICVIVGKSRRCQLIIILGGGVIIQTIWACQVRPKMVSCHLILNKHDCENYRVLAHWICHFQLKAFISILHSFETPVVVWVCDVEKLGLLGELVIVLLGTNIFEQRPCGARIIRDLKGKFSWICTPRTSRYLQKWLNCGIFRYEVRQIDGCISKCLIAGIYHTTWCKAKKYQDRFVKGHGHWF